MRKKVQKRPTPTPPEILANHSRPGTACISRDSELGVPLVSSQKSLEGRAAVPPRSLRSATLLCACASVIRSRIIAHVVKPDLCCGHSSHAQSSRVQVVLGPWSPCCRKRNLSIETIVCAIYEPATRKPQPRRPPVEASPRCIGDVMPRPWLFTRIAVQVQVGNG